MKAKEFIKEGLSSILYHTTSIHALAKILKSNEFVLTPAVGTSAEMDLLKNQKFYYFSTTRSMLGSYGNDPYKIAVSIKLDGDKLGHNYSGNPVDYWGPAFRKTDPAKFEMEDRIFSKTPNIPNASKYITEVHMLVIDADDMPDRQKRLLRRILIMLKASGMNYYIYDNNNNYITQNKAKAIQGIDAASIKSKEKEEFYHRTKLSQYKNNIVTWIELATKWKESELSKPAMDLVWYIRQYAYNGEPLIMLKNTLHNAKGSHQVERPDVDKLLKILADRRIKNIDEFYKQMETKWDVKNEIK
jgi:hypothetical protein